MSHSHPPSRRIGVELFRAVRATSGVTAMSALRILDNPPYAPSAPVSDAWLAHHRYLIDVAYRMLGSLSEAEDVVQEAFVRLLRVEIGPSSTHGADGAGGLAPIVDVRGWLVVAVTRLCLDQLRSARARHEVYTGPWLPEPLLGGPGAEPDPAERVTLDDSVRMALLVVLERLTPAERAAFVLHD